MGGWCSKLYCLCGPYSASFYLLTIILNLSFTVGSRRPLWSRVTSNTLKALNSKELIGVHIRNSMNRGHSYGFTRSNGSILILHWFCHLDEYMSFFLHIRSIASCISISTFSTSNPNSVHLTGDTLKVKTH